MINNISSKTVIYFDEFDREIKRIVTSEEDNYKHTVSYEYDTLCNKTIYWYNKKIVNRYRNIYNKDNRLIKQYTLTSEEQITSYETYKYEEAKIKIYAKFSKSDRLLAYKVFEYNHIGLLNKTCVYEFMPRDMKNYILESQLNK